MASGHIEKSRAFDLDDEASREKLVRLIARIRRISCVNDFRGTVRKTCFENHFLCAPWRLLQVATNATTCYAQGKVFRPQRRAMSDAGRSREQYKLSQTQHSAVQK